MADANHTATLAEIDSLPLQPGDRRILSRALNAILDDAKDDDESLAAERLHSALSVARSLEELPRLTDDERDSLDTHAPVAAAPIGEPGPCFHDHESGRRYEGFPAPLPCPFCGHVEFGGIVEVDCGEACDPRMTYHVQCDCCGAEGPPQMSAREAAEAWNGARPESFERLLDDCQARIFEALEVLGLAHDVLSGRGAHGRAMSAIAAARRILKPLEVLGDTIAMREAARRLSPLEVTYG